MAVQKHIIFECKLDIRTFKYWIQTQGGKRIAIVHRKAHRKELLKILNDAKLIPNDEGLIEAYEIANDYLDAVGDSPVSSIE